MAAELKDKFGSEHEYNFIELDEISEELPALKQAVETASVVSDVILCFGSAWSWRLFDETGKIVFVEASSDSLSEIFSEKLNMTLYGFCGLPTFLNRPLLEVSLYNPENASQLTEVCAALGTDYRVVQDRVGLVTPRVICMIINEACYTLQEGTATIQDIDKSMKLGTSYPRGPFEWANMIGVSRVYEVLEALWQDTHEERYKVCPLLKTMYLRGESFAL
jgi:3-hydroxybutyryl-CoA dehydrogenase